MIIFGWALIVIGVLIAIKLKFMLVGVGLVISALFIHYFFNVFDKFIKNQDIKNKVQGWFRKK